MKKKKRKTLSNILSLKKGKTLLGTSAYEKLQCNEDILAHRNVITGVGRGLFFHKEIRDDAVLRVAFSPDLICLAWRGSCGSSCQGCGSRLHCVPHTFSHTFLAALCHIDLNVSVEGKIINANSLAVQPTNKTCLIHQADIAIKTTLSALSHFSLSVFPSLSLLSHLWATSLFFTLFTFLCLKPLSLN